MALQKQIHLYSVDTSAFYKEDEKEIHKKLNELYIFRSNLHDKINKTKDENLKSKLNKCFTITNKRIKDHKNELCKLLNMNSDIRNLDPVYLNKYNIVSVFESSLNRIMDIPENSLITDIIIVQTYFFDVLEDIILDGFMYNGNKYVCFTASAGQIRTKKTVFIKEKVLKKHQNTLMCGLTIEDINRYGGVNINKYLAYLALCNSATDLWKDFDITKSIVVNDMETLVNGDVDFIDDITYEIKRCNMNVPINHTDGCGMILPKLSKKSMMVRLPWVKGLLVPFPFDEFIKEHNENNKGTNYGMVTDIYGNKHDIIKDDIQVIFTKSQFKMYKYYTSWKQYTDNFIKYGCQAGKCNEEEDIFNYAKINYQMLQTLTDMTDKEIEIISKRTKNNIINIGTDKKTMLKTLGVTVANTRKNYLQQALEIYPELLNDTYSKTILKQVKKSLVKEGRAGKLDINGKYTFICPDLYAFCEYLILGNKTPKGLLDNNEVYCSLYEDKPKLDCLRSPHLFLEHAVRNNRIDEKKKKWFITKGLYTSCHDLISKILQFDVDGDKSLVCADSTIIGVAERNSKDIAPLFYNMKKAEAELITNANIYKGITLAYKGGNIGEISNNISKIWNSTNINLKAIKLLCMENNFTIDYAKTLYKPERPKDIKELISGCTKYKVPHFFIYAKDKTKNEVEKINNSVVNKLEKNIPNTKINFKHVCNNDFNYKMLMCNKKINIDYEIINKYKELDLKKHFVILEPLEEDTNDNLYIYIDIRNQLLEINNDINYVVDVLVEYLYKYKNSSFKTTLWSSFGDILVRNLKNNIKLNNIYCEMCGDLIEQKSNKTKYCKECAKYMQLQWDKEYQARKRKNRVIEKSQNTYE